MRRLSSFSFYVLLLPQVCVVSNHSITEWLRLERASAGHLVQTPSSSRVDPVDPCLKLFMSIVHLNGWVLQYTVSAFTKAQP